MSKIQTASERMREFIDVDGLKALKRVEDISLKYSQFVQQEIDELRSRINGLEAARIAYASEFELNVEGEPDVGSIHQNIRKLKQNLDEAKRDQERYQFIRAQGYYDTEDENDIGKFEIFQMTDLMCAEGRDHESLDEAIDIAIKKSKGLEHE